MAVVSFEAANDTTLYDMIQFGNCADEAVLQHLNRLLTFLDAHPLLCLHKF